VHGPRVSHHDDGRALHCCPKRDAATVASRRSAVQITATTRPMPRPTSRIETALCSAVGRVSGRPAFRRWGRPSRPEGRPNRGQGLRCAGLDGSPIAPRQCDAPPEQPAKPPVAAGTRLPRAGATCARDVRKRLGPWPTTRSRPTESSRDSGRPLQEQDVQHRAPEPRPFDLFRGQGTAISGLQRLREPAPCLVTCRVDGAGRNRLVRVLAGGLARKGVSTGSTGASLPSLRHTFSGTAWISSAGWPALS
jgi:hypothetical protein